LPVVQYPDIPVLTTYPVEEIPSRIYAWGFGQLRPTADGHGDIADDDSAWGHKGVQQWSYLSREFFIFPIITGSQIIVGQSSSFT
jgi:hypothetical protein